MPRDDKAAQRRLETPERQAVSCRSAGRRSRSRARRESHSYRSRSSLRSSERGRTQDQALDEEVKRQRQRIHELEGGLQRQRNMNDNMDNVRDRSMEQERRPEMRRSQRVQQDELRATAARRDIRSVSPLFTSKDVANIVNSLNSLKPKPQPSPVTTLSHSNSHINQKNILPEFDPSSKVQRIDVWIKKVNECATVYGWDEKTVIHFAMQNSKDWLNFGTKV
ncbi:unnamed protein product [Arctia plantaginis]|uniref:Uncharacterized protein n=1 Tax=Arctia plantaginis TaxID=874455 RepID=A0A8S1BAE6_ARCPL|nr:unnamed protein product [Arctia plantaginis]